MLRLKSKQRKQGRFSWTSMDRQLRATSQSGPMDQKWNSCPFTVQELQAMVGGGSYSGFELSPADHMWMCLEVSIPDLLGIQHINIPSPPKRRVASKNILVQENLLQAQVEKHNLHKRRVDLETMILTDAYWCSSQSSANRCSTINRSTHRANTSCNATCQ